MVLDGITNMISDHFVATLNTTNFVYTGDVIRLKASDVTVVDKDTKADLSNYLKADKDGYVSLKATDVQQVGKTTFRLNLITGQPETGNKNYKIAELSSTSNTDKDGYRTVETDKANVTARDLSAVNVEVPAQSIPANGKLVFDDNEFGTFKFTDAQGTELKLANAYPFVVSAITPSQPAITSVKVKGSTVTVTYTKSSNADGYDVVLGSKVATVAGEKRPVEYGTLVKKNIKGNTVTATFKNVKKGTYYAGLHAFNRTSEDGKKVFSPWSNVKKVTVK